ncbi:hypothetical protein ASD56_14435 [Microbacterium sp. Root166]|uniref:acyltransferase family protein n=1 Tax=Microbacterium sp. Root166 TaxID=1736478 RepID=UPI0006F7F11F|nr:acyltransferase family protein [Microbacterium sp. Root166]KQZ82084.1 hypothetical protein ASD56_14435 [Microbacterium sp. Root166]
MKSRDRSVDVLKGIGIIVVIMGHVDLSAVGGAFISYLYSFNVALFFIVAGYLWKDKPGQGFFAFAVVKARQIYLPYVVLFCVSLLYGHLIVRYVFGEYVIPFDFVDSVKALLFSSEWLNSVPTFNFALWFLPIFFISTLVFWVLQRVRDMRIYVPLIVIIALSALPFQSMLPGRPILAINVLPVALAFMGFGFLLRRWVPVGRIPWLALVGLFGVSIILAWQFPGNVAGVGTLWYFPGAVASFIVYLRIARDIESSSFLAYVGEYSLLMFGLHSLVAKSYLFTGTTRLFDEWASGLMGYVLNVTYVVIGTFIIVKVYRWVRERVADARRGRYASVPLGPPISGADA